MLQDPQVLGNDHNKPHSLMSDPISIMYFHNMFCDLLNKILFKPKKGVYLSKIIVFGVFCHNDHHGQCLAQNANRKYRRRAFLSKLPK